MIEVVATGTQVGVVHLVENLIRYPDAAESPFAQALVAYQIDRLPESALSSSISKRGVDIEGVSSRERSHARRSCSAAARIARSTA